MCRAAQGTFTSEDHTFTVVITPVKVWWLNPTSPFADLGGVEQRDERVDAGHPVGGPVAEGGEVAAGGFGVPQRVGRAVGGAERHRDVVPGLAGLVGVADLLEQPDRLLVEAQRRPGLTGVAVDVA